MLHAVLSRVTSKLWYCFVNSETQVALDVITLGLQSAAGLLPMHLAAYGGCAFGAVVVACSESQAQAACDVRNSRYNRRLLSVVEDMSVDSASGTMSTSSSFPDRLNQVRLQSYLLFT